MELTEEVHGRVVVVTARGRLDQSASAAFGAQLEKLAAASQPRLLIDFAGVDYVSSAGLRAVLALLKRVKAANGTFALCAVQPPVQEVLEITGFAGMLEIHAERRAAIAALA
jgi:anti-sigma B factor antagonist